MANPDLETSRAIAKYQAGALHMLTSPEWDRLFTRAHLERESNKVAMRQGQMDAARGFNTPNAQTYLASVPQAPRQQAVAQLMDQPQQQARPEPWTPKNLPGPNDMVTYNNVPGQGDVTLYGGRYNKNAPRPEAGYGYVGGIAPYTEQGSYVNITPGGTYRSSSPGTNAQDYYQQVNGYVPQELSGHEEIPQAPASPAAPAQSSVLEQLLNKPPIPLSSLLSNTPTGKLAPKPVSSGTQANEAVADFMRGAGYGATNFLRPSAWTGSYSGGIAFTPEKSPAYQEQIRSRLAALSDQNSPTAMALKKEIGGFGITPSTSPIATANIFDGTQATSPKKSVNPATAAGLLLGPSFKKKAEETFNTPAGPTSDREAMEGNPYGNYDVASLQQDQQTQMQQAQAQAPELGIHTPADSMFQQVDTSSLLAQRQTQGRGLPADGYQPLQVPEFKPRNPFEPTSATEALAAPRLKEDLDRYNKNVTQMIALNKHNLEQRREAYKEGRDAVKDSLEIALKGTQIQKEQLGLVSDKLKLMFRANNKPAELNIGGKNLIVIPTGPDTTRVIEVKPDTSPSEKTAMVKVAYNQQLQDAVASGDLATAERAFSVLNPGWMATNSMAFQSYVDERMKAMGKGKPATAVPKKGQAPAAKAQAPKQGAAAQPQIRYDREGRAVQLINGQWVLVQ